jgi:DNA-binding CsgD family transcriptional regulator
MAGIFFLSLVDDNEADAVLLLLVVPIALVAAGFGWAGGLSAAAASTALFAVWEQVEEGASVGPLGYLTRIVVFFGFAAAIGLLLDRRASLFEDGPGHRLVNTPQRAFDGLVSGDQLSDRELEVLELLARGATNAQIAARFVISEQTVKSHVKHILKKLDVGNRTEAALRYVQLYGHPSRLDPPQAGVPTARARPGASEHSATVVGLSPGGGVLVRLEDARTIEVPLVEGLRNRFDVGSPALVYFDPRGTLVGWYLPDAGIGVDMQDERRRQGGS